MRELAITAALTIMLLMSFKTFADETIRKGQALTVEKCVEIALERHPSVLAAKYGVNVRASRVGLAKSEKYPQISWLMGYSRESSEHATNEYSGTMNLSQNIWDFGKIETRTKIQKLYLKSSEADLDDVRASVVFNVKQAYYGLLRARRDRDVSREEVAQYERHLKQAKIFYRAGAKAKFDATRAEVNLSNAKLNMIRSENSLMIAKINLDNAMGLPNAPAYEIQDNLDFKKYVLSLEEAVRRAYVSRHDLHSLRGKQRAALESAKLARKDYYPKLSGNASYNWSKTDSASSRDELPGDIYYNQSNSSSPRDDWKIMFQFSVPLFTGHSTHFQIEESLATLNVLKAEEASLRQNILLEIRKSYLNLREAEERIAASLITVKQARENLDLVNGRYSAGVGHPIEVTDAQVVYSGAKTSYNQALYDYKIARASLERAMGEK